MNQEPTAIQQSKSCHQKASYLLDLIFQDKNQKLILELFGALTVEQMTTIIQSVTKKYKESVVNLQKSQYTPLKLLNLDLKKIRRQKKSKIKQSENKRRQTQRMTKHLAKQAKSNMKYYQNHLTSPRLSISIYIISVFFVCFNVCEWTPISTILISWMCIMLYRVFIHLKQKYRRQKIKKDVKTQSIKQQQIKEEAVEPYKIENQVSQPIDIDNKVELIISNVKSIDPEYQPVHLFQQLTFDESPLVAKKLANASLLLSLQTERTRQQIFLNDYVFEINTILKEKVQQHQKDQLMQCFFKGFQKTQQENPGTIIKLTSNRFIFQFTIFMLVVCIFFGCLVIYHWMPATILFWIYILYKNYKLLPYYRKKIQSFFNKQKNKQIQKQVKTSNCQQPAGKQESSREKADQVKVIVLECKSELNASEKQHY